MIVLYTVLLLAAGALKFLIGRRARSLEGRYVQAAVAAGNLAREPIHRPGSKLDPCEIARRQYQLGSLVQRRDRLEARYHCWQQKAERLGKFVALLKHWKGKKLPYTMGVVDVSFLMYLVDRLGMGEYASVARLVQLATTYLSR